MYKDGRRMTRACEKCQMYNVAHKKKSGPMKPMVTQVEPFTTVSIDFAGPYKTSAEGNKFVFGIIDQATRYTELIASEDQATETVIAVLQARNLNRYFTVKSIVLDNGASFTSKKFIDFCTSKAIQLIFTSPYHAASNTYIERLNQTFGSMLAKAVQDDPDSWDIQLPKVAYSYNIAKHSVTQYSPFYLLYGRQPRMAIDNKFPVNDDVNLTAEERRFRIYRDRVKANENTCRHQLKTKIQFDKDHPSIEFSEGDKVLHRKFTRQPGTAAKFSVKWHGPYEIHSKVGPLTYMLSKPGEINSESVIMAHIHNLKEFTSPLEASISSITEDDSDTSYDDSDLDRIQYINNNVAEQIFEPVRDDIVSSDTSSDDTVIQPREDDPPVPREVDEMSESSASTVRENDNNENGNASDASESSSTSQANNRSPVRVSPVRHYRSRSGRKIRPPKVLNIDPKSQSYRKLSLISKIISNLVNA